MESKIVNITLDNASLDILREVDSIHRDSLINVALSIVKQTGYYKTLTGKSKTDDIEEVASLDVEDNQETKKVKKTETVAEQKKKPAPAKNWDAF